MRRRATHPLHVLACAPVAAIAAATFALAPHASAAATSAGQHPPQPYVVAIDPGHGGTADNSRPDQPFDPGVVAPNGLLEKDVTLDVARRLAALLRADDVRVVMTRTDDSYVGIGPRMQAAIDAGAQLFVSIHFNSWTDPSTGGALILYPNDASLPFAQTMSAALTAELQQRYGIADDGVQSKPDLWVHATMPAITVEGAYMTNPREAGLLTDGGFRDALAEAIRNGIEKQAPQITTLAAQISRWNATHRTAPRQPLTGTATTDARAPAGAGGTLLRWMLTLGLLALLWRWRRRTLPALRWTYAHVRHGIGDRPGSAMGTSARRRARSDRHGGREVSLAGHGLTLATSWRGDAPLTQRLSATTRRRRSARRRAVLLRAARPAPTRRSVYDELWF
jgi:N-acetylmuramoyl-L-alanine amidase